MGNNKPILGVAILLVAGTTLFFTNHWTKSKTLPQAPPPVVEPPKNGEPNPEPPITPPTPIPIPPPSGKVKMRIQLLGPDGKVIADYTVLTEPNKGS